MSVQTDGIISGIDTSSLITELAAPLEKQKALIQAKITDIETRQADYSSLNTLMEALSTSLEDLQSTNKFRSFTASNQTTDAFSVTVDGDATVGSYSLAVTQTAKSDILMIGNAGSATSGFRHMTV